MASTIASRRLFHEYKLLTSAPPDGITAGPVSEDDIFLWEALIQGPDGTPFEGGVFPAELKFPRDYPLNPPTMRFVGEVWHPNGRCCFVRGFGVWEGVSLLGFSRKWVTITGGVFFLDLPYGQRVFRAEKQS